ncbi:uncharacterized protein RB166_011345 [Leptodactylus fuscus]
MAPLYLLCVLFCGLVSTENFNSTGSPEKFNGTGPTEKFNRTESLSNPTLIWKSLTTVIGKVETIRCISNGSLPINYTLFINQVMVASKTATEEKGATFNVTIYNHTRLGPYKCKANKLYSKALTFTLQDAISHSDEQDVAYCTVVIGERNAASIRTAESLEYAQVVRKTS